MLSQLGRFRANLLATKIANTREKSTANALELLKKQRSSNRTGNRLRPSTSADENSIADGDLSLPPAFRRPAMDVNHIQEAQLPLAEAVHLMRSLAVGKRDCPVAVHVQCRGADSTVRELRGTVVLPVSFRKNRTLVLAEPEIAEEAKLAGADIVGGEELIAMIETEQLHFDRVIATPKMMPHLSKVARVLGPRGLMPTVKKGTITNDVVKAMKDQADAVIFKADSNGYISAIIGKCGLSRDELELNIRTFLTEMKSMKKGKQSRFVQRLAIQAENHPEVGVDRTELNL